MDALLYIHTEAIDRSAAGLLPACAAGGDAMTFTGVTPVVRHRGALAAGGTDALVARCVL